MDNILPFSDLPLEINNKIMFHVFDQEDRNSIKSLFETSSTFNRGTSESLLKYTVLIFHNLRNLENRNKNALDDVIRCFSVIPSPHEWELLPRLRKLKETLIPYPLVIKKISCLEPQAQFILARDLKNKLAENQEKLKMILELQQEILNSSKKS